MLSGASFSLAFSRALGKVIVHVFGELDCETAGELDARLVDAIDGQGNLQIVVDLRATTLIDSAGISVLVDALGRVREKGGELVLSGPTCTVARAFGRAGLDEVFEITPAWAHPAHGGSLSDRGMPVAWSRNN